MEWDVGVETGARRVLPALPVHDPEWGEIRWGRWQRSARITHFDGSCGSCGYPGPLARTEGRGYYTPPPSMKRVARGRRENGRRVPSTWVRVQRAPYWVWAFHAVRCQVCDEMIVWVMSGQVPRCGECGALSPQELEGKRAQCGVCLRSAPHVRPSTGRHTTWVEIAYHPPVVQAVPPCGGFQEETLF